MLWDYAELVDGTSFGYSATREDGTVRITVERPREFGFDYAECLLPLCNWKESSGFTDDELAHFRTFIKNNAPLIYEMADERASENA